MNSEMWKVYIFPCMLHFCTQLTNNFFVRNHKMSTEKWHCSWFMMRCKWWRNQAVSVIILHRENLSRIWTILLQTSITQPPTLQPLHLLRKKAESKVVL